MQWPSSLLLLLAACSGLVLGLVAQAPDAGPAAAPAKGPPPATAARGPSATCQSCHPDVVDAYAETAHARSLTRFDAATAPETFGDATVCNAPSNLCYEAFVEDGQLYQREFRRDAEGRVIHEITHQADYVIGSGNATRSYLMDVDGYLTEMPLTWYVEDEKWAMSPGYEASNDRFARQINQDCMTCHNATPARTSFTQNHYTDVPLGISCQRCHAEAEAHAAFQASGATGDDPITRNASRSRSQQLSTCQQCHLAGITVFEPGEDATTYEAGEPLHANRTVYVPDKQLTDPDWVGIDSHPIRLARSACFQESAMTCTTCHDPHTPADAFADADYNQTCQSCHEQPEQQTLCARPEATTPEIATRGNCVSCHLQRGGTDDVPHVTFTDHWIRKNPAPRPKTGAGRPSIDTPDPLDLVPLRDMTSLDGTPPPSPRADAAATTAYFRFYETMHRHPAYIQRAVEHGRRALRAGSVDVTTRIALARALAESDAVHEAASVMETAVQAHPEDAWAHYWHGAMTEAAGQLRGAQAAYQRAVSIQPKMVEAQLGLAGVLQRTGQAAQARQRLETLVTLDSVHVPQAWFNLGVLRAEAGDVRGARDAWRTASRLNPDLVEAHVQLGRLYFKVELYDRAQQHFRDALAADPQSTAAHGSLGLLYLQTGRPAQARRHLQRVLALDPDNEAARQLLERLP